MTFINFQFLPKFMSYTRGTYRDSQLILFSVVFRGASTPLPRTFVNVIFGIGWKFFRFFCWWRMLVCVGNAPIREMGKLEEGFIGWIGWVYFLSVFRWMDLAGPGLCVRSTEVGRRGGLRHCAFLCVCVFGRGGEMRWMR